jgi:hypothetical protein
VITTTVTLRRRFQPQQRSNDGAHAALGDAIALAAYLVPLKHRRWFVYTKRPFAGPKAVLAYA